MNADQLLGPDGDPPSVSNKHKKGKVEMKKGILTVVMVCTLFAFVTMSALAGGGKVRGDNGQGEVMQVQVQDPPPFQP